MNLVGNEIFMTTANNYISERVRAALGATAFPPNAIVFAKVGAAVYLDRKRLLAIPSCIDNNMAAFVVDPERADARFVHFALRNFKLSTLVAVGALPSLNGKQLRSIPILLPPTISEQEEVAAVLADADDLIASLERLITKKRGIRQGMRQQLLTGRTRLPGCADPWQDHMVRDLLEFKNGLNKASEYFGHGTPIVNFMDVMKSPIITSDRVKGLVSLSSDEIKRFSAQRGDLFFTRTSETVDEIGTAAVLVDDIPRASFSGFVLRGRPKSPHFDPTFLALVFHLQEVRKQVVSSASYTTRALTNGGSLGRVRVTLPDREEQLRIVLVLQDVDAEIDALIRRLESARAVKKGMMQELLTGRTRLPIAEVAA